MDSFFAYAHFALQNFNMLPSDFLALPAKEKAFIIASMQINTEDMNKQRGEQDWRKR